MSEKIVRQFVMCFFLGFRIVIVIIMGGGQTHIPSTCIMPAFSSRDLLIAQIGGHVTNPCKRSLKTAKKVTGKKLVENIYLHFPLNVAVFSTFMYLNVVISPLIYW